MPSDLSGCHSFRSVTGETYGGRQRRGTAGGTQAQTQHVSASQRQRWLPLLGYPQLHLPKHLPRGSWSHLRTSDDAASYPTSDPAAHGPAASAPPRQVVLQAAESPPRQLPASTPGRWTPRQTFCCHVVLRGCLRWSGLARSDIRRRVSAWWPWRPNTNSSVFSARNHAWAHPWAVCIKATHGSYGYLERWQPRLTWPRGPSHAMMLREEGRRRRAGVGARPR